ncbi:MAG: dTDP-4-dehydrorhamnose 3,5-epimerase family protein [Bacteroidota bacterium]
MFQSGSIEGVVVKELVKRTDRRGWLVELFRHDELDGEYYPRMVYISMTKGGVARGPHEHNDQADLFCFLGPSNFKVYLWDNRKQSPTYQNKMVINAGEDEPKSILIPAGVVHAYKNAGSREGMAVNCPNRLYAGEGRKEQVDEIRHESDPQSIFELD